MMKFKNIGGPHFDEVQGVTVPFGGECYSEDNLVDKFVNHFELIDSDVEPPAPLVVQGDGFEIEDESEGEPEEGDKKKKKKR